MQIFRRRILYCTDQNRLMPITLSLLAYLVFGMTKAQLLSSPYSAWWAIVTCSGYWHKRTHHTNGQQEHPVIPGTLQSKVSAKHMINMPIRERSTYKLPRSISESKDHESDETRSKYKALCKPSRMEDSKLKGQSSYSSLGVW